VYRRAIGEVSCYRHNSVLCVCVRARVSASICARMCMDIRDAIDLTRDRTTRKNLVYKLIVNLTDGKERLGRDEEVYNNIHNR